MAALRAFNLLVLTALAASSCEKGGSDSDLLDIERDYRAVRLEPGYREAEFVEVNESEPASELLENGLFRRVFHMRPSLARSLSRIEEEAGAIADPFAEPKMPARPIRGNAGLQELFRRAGIEFPEGTSIRYDESKWQLVVVNSEEQLDLVEAYLDSLLVHYETRILVRMEIYEMPTLQAMQLVESASHESSHTPERNAAFKATRGSDVRLVSVPSLTARSGNRALIEFVDEPRRGGTVGEKDESPEPPTREPLARFEVDPVLGADGETLDLRFALEHPVSAPVRDKDPGGARAPGASTRTVRLSGQTTLTLGSHVMFGSWDAGADRVQVAFLTASEQSLEPVQPVVKVAPDDPRD